MALKSYRSDGTIIAARPSALRRAAIPEETAKNPKQLAEVLTRQQEDIQFLKSSLSKTLEFNRSGTGGVNYSFTHKFGVQASWWIVDWYPPSASTAPSFARVSDDGQTLVIRCNNTGTFRVRMEASSGS